MDAHLLRHSLEEGMFQTGDLVHYHPLQYFLVLTPSHEVSANHECLLLKWKLTPVKGTLYLVDNELRVIYVHDDQHLLNDDLHDNHLDVLILNVLENDQHANEHIYSHNHRNNIDHFLDNQDLQLLDSNIHFGIHNIPLQILLLSLGKNDILVG